MKVSELKELLKDAPDDMDVLIPVNATIFDGMFLHACAESSGIAEMGIDNNSNKTRNDFILVPCGFFEEKEEEGPPPELN